MTAIAMNLLWLRPRMVGGSETYVRRLLRAVSEHDPSLEWHLFGSQEAIDAARPPQARVTPHTPGKRSLPPALRIAVERTWLRRALDPATDVIHHPGGTLPFVGEVPAVLTIHDLQPLDYPENFSPVKQRFLARAIPDGVQRADVVTTPSDWVRESVIDRFNVAPDRVVTVSAYAEPLDLSMPAEPSVLLERILDDGPVFFYPAMTLAHKNHRMLFEAFGAAIQHEPDLQLVCTGAVGRDDDAIRTLARATSPRIRMLGHVPRHDLDALYLRSETLMFPSRYEGFGLPIIEAQHAGLPVIAARGTALTEIAGDAATLLDPDDVEGWTEALLTRLAPPERAVQVAAGHANAARFSVEQTAQQQRSAYDRLTP